MSTTCSGRLPQPDGEVDFGLESRDFFEPICHDEGAHVQ